MRSGDRCSRRGRPRGLLDRPSSRPIGRIEVTISSPGTTSSSQASGGAGVLADPAEGDDHRQADHERAEGQRGPAAVARTRPRASRSSMRAKSANGAPAIAPAGRQDERDDERRDEQHAVDGERGCAPSPAAGGQASIADDGDDGEGTRSSQRRRARRRRQVEAGLERLDRRDAAARRAGSIAATSVTPMPDERRRGDAGVEADDRGGRGRPSAGR